MGIWRHLAELTALPDTTLCDHLEFGFPAGFHGDITLVAAQKNHFSAVRDATKVKEFIDNEVVFNALLGPFTLPPFEPWVQVNPLMTKDKRIPGGKFKKRIITDLSWPHGNSVNDGIGPDLYMGDPLTFKLPQSDNLIALILEEGRYCYLYSHDIARAYRNLCLDPLSWPLFTLHWDDHYFTDISAPFGLRTAASFCQRTTSAVCHFLWVLHKVRNLNYIDDFSGAKKAKSDAMWEV